MISSSRPPSVEAHALLIEGPVKVTSAVSRALSVSVLGMVPLAKVSCATTGVPSSAEDPLHMSRESRAEAVKVPKEATGHARFVSRTPSCSECMKTVRRSSGIEQKACTSTLASDEATDTRWPSASFQNS